MTTHLSVITVPGHHSQEGDTDPKVMDGRESNYILEYSRMFYGPNDGTEVWPSYKMARWLSGLKSLLQSPSEF